ncbi:FUSC family protein [Streptomyces sp. J2-1]|uniref:FUSC family protein n=1 Tax=Streptomyces corallincola TaxID=2851888 RepID=UPI001C388065|nr:FUSC family protein [Streptomyces corallincola]MBV2353840.1 FUSC family protein [Streptomyces corallincola]
MPIPGRTRAGVFVAWLRAHDPDLAATRRSVRTALVMPSLYALCIEVLHSVTMATFAAFGSFAMLLLVEFTGPMTQRVRAHVALTAAWVVLICLGTLVAGQAWLAVVSMVVIGFLVLFSGVVSSVLAGASTPLLLAFVLPLTVPAPLSALPQRLAGVGLAAVVALGAITLLWPRRASDPLAAPAARACRAFAGHLRFLADGGGDGGPGGPAATADVAGAELRRVFDATPYRPTGLGSGSRALVRLIDELAWLHGMIDDDAAASAAAPTRIPAVDDARHAAALVLDRAADLLDRPQADPEPFDAAVRELRTAMAALDRDAAGGLPLRPPAGAGSGGRPADLIDEWDRSFRAHELCFATLLVAGDVDRMAAAERRGWRERLLGHDPDTLTTPLASARERAASHARPHSVWLHNSVRGALTLGLAVAVVRVTGVAHSFWVLLGILAVLSSSAVTTGQRALRALAGTVAGALVGVGLLEVFGAHEGVLWAMLPLAILCAGIATPVSFAVGQASFSVILCLLFNVGQPLNLQVAVARVEDIALGCAVSLLAALAFWPRGAAGVVHRTLGQAYVAAARYLDRAVRYGAVRGGVEETGGAGRAGVVSGADDGVPHSPVPHRPLPHSPAPAPPLEERREAAAAARRLDDALRGYLVERGADKLPLADITTLVTGVAAVRMAADAISGIWEHRTVNPSAGEETRALLAVRSAADRITEWYEELAASLDGGRPVPVPLPAIAHVEAMLSQLLSTTPAARDPHAGTAVLVLWTADYLKATRRLQPSLTAALRSKAERSRATGTPRARL